MAAVSKRQARSAGISYQELISRDVVPPPRTLTLESRFDAPPDDGARHRVTRRRRFTISKCRHLWPKVGRWRAAKKRFRTSATTRLRNRQFLDHRRAHAAGDLARTTTSVAIAAASCCDADGHAASFICPFHGFSWNLDGSLRSVTSEWDFPHIDKKNFDLNAVQCDTWGGWVFINMDLKSGTAGEVHRRPATALRGVEAGEPLHRSARREGDGLQLEVCQEAFMEAFHVIHTHPQILVGIGDENSQYDAWGNFSRAITPNATPSPHLRFKPTEQEMFDSVTMRYLDQPAAGEVPAGMTARAMLAAGGRMGMQQIVGADTPSFGCVRFRQHLLHAVPELPSVGRLQPDRVPVPAVSEPVR